MQNIQLHLTWGVHNSSHSAAQRSLSRTSPTCGQDSIPADPTSAPSCTRQRSWEGKENRETKIPDGGQEWEADSSSHQHDSYKNCHFFSRKLHCFTQCALLLTSAFMNRRFKFMCTKRKTQQSLLRWN